MLSESLEEYTARRRSWDERAVTARTAWTGHRHDGDHHRQRPQMPEGAPMSTLHIKVVNHTNQGAHPEVHAEAETVPDGC